MRSLAPRHRLIGVLFALLGTLCASACAAQSPGEAGPRPSTFSARSLVLPGIAKIEAASAQGETLVILRDDDRSWKGVLETAGRVWTGSEDDCPAFAGALAQVRDLPPLYPGPSDLRHEGATTPMGSYAPHATHWRLHLVAFAPDRTSIMIEMEGSQGPYPAWASQMAEAMRSCRLEPN